MKGGVQSCLIMQHKPYIVEQSFMETQKSHDSIIEEPSLTTEGPPQTNVVQVNEKIVNCGGAYRDCIKGMETRSGCRVNLKCAEFHGDNNDMTITPYLIMQ